MTTIKLKNGSGAPTAGDLVQGEPALDLTNKRLYTEDSGGTVIEVGTNPTSITTGDITATGTVSFAGLGTTGDVTFGDNDKAIFGAGSDLQIYHDGSNSYITDSGTGNLRISGSLLQLNDASFNKYLLGSGDSVTLYHADTAKLATTSTGIDVTGTVTADDAVYVEGSSPRLQLQDTDGTNQLSFMQQSGEDTILRLRNNTADGGFTVAGYGGATTTNRFYIQPTGDISFYNDAGTSQDLYWDASTSRLGLGTTSPSVPLDVRGSVKFGDTATGISFEIESTDEYRINGFDVDGNAFNSLHFRADGTDGLFVQKDTNNVGIGVTNPSNPLTVSGSAGTIASFTNGADADLLIKAESSVTTLTPTTGTLALGTSNTERMRIDSSGRLLVGTSSVGYSGVDLTVGDTADSQNGIAVQTSTTGYGYVLFGDGTGTDAFRGQLYYKHGDDFMAMHTAGSERMRITSAGNVGIGTTSPAYELDVNSTIHIGNDGGSSFSHSRLILDSNGASRAAGIFSHNQVNDTEWFFGSPYDTPDSFAINRQSTTTHADSTANKTNSLVTVDSSGNVGIGTTSPNVHGWTKALSIDGGTSSSSAVELNQNGTKVGALGLQGDQRLQVVNYSANPITFHTNGIANERMRIDSSGNLLIGGSSAGINVTTIDGGRIRLDKAGDWSIESGYQGGTSGSHMRILHGGTQVGSITSTASATSYNTSSDQRLKENIVDAPSASDDIDAIQVRSFDWKANGSHQKYGMIAQELNTVAPEAVTEGETEEDMMSVDYSKLVPMLVKEIQSLRARVAQLEGAN